MIRKLSVALAVVASLAVPTMAAAEDLSPTSPQLQWLQSVASTYWHGLPPCGTPKVTLDAPPTVSGEAWQSTCTISLNPALDWRDYPEKLCGVYVHEYGHLVLGPTYFAAMNPADPAHSADPSSIMFDSGDTPTAALESVGCVSRAPRVVRSWVQPRPAGLRIAERRAKHHRRRAIHKRAKAEASPP